MDPREKAPSGRLWIFQTQKVHHDKTEAWCVLARTLLAQGKAADAKEAMQHARSLVVKSHDPNTGWPVTSGS